MPKDKKPILKRLLYMTLFGISLLGMILTIKYVSLNPFERIFLENTSAVTLDKEGDLYVVSDSNRRVSKIVSGDQLRYQIRGGSREEGSFYLASEIAADDSGQLYLLENQLDASGSFIKEEAIHLYDEEGRQTKTLFSLMDETQTKLLPSIKGLSYQNGHLRWQVLDETGISLYTDQSQKAIGKILYPNAALMIQDVKPLGERTLVFISKDGFVYQQSVGEKAPQILFKPTEASKAIKTNLWGIQVGKDNHLYILDLGQFGIFSLEKGQLKAVFNSEKVHSNRKEAYFYFHFSEKEMVAGNDNGVVRVSSSGKVEPLGDLKISQGMLALKLLADGFVLAFLVAVLLLWRFLFDRYIRHIRLSEIGVTIPILTAVTVAAIAISYLAINYYGKIIERQAVDNLKMVVQNSKFVVEGDLVEQMTSPTDFNGPTYQKIADQLQKLINYNTDVWNENLYTAMYTIIGDRYYALVYNDNRVTPFYPFNAFTEEPHYQYFLKAYKGEITEGKEEDADGQWIFSMGPVYNRQHEIVGIVEVGMNKYIFDEWTRSVEKKILIDIVSIIIVLVLLIAELSFLSGWFKARREQLLFPSEEIPFNDLSILRGLAVYIYIAIFMCTPFIPVMAKSIYQPIGSLPMTVTLGLPIFFEVLTTAITILFAGVIAERRGWRTIFYAGATILILAAIVTALTQSLVLFIAIRAIAGIGNGFIQMTMYAFINLGESESKRNEAFAHMMSGAIAGTNLGFVIGANMAEKIGYANVFYMMAFFGILSIVFERMLLRHYPARASVVLEEIPMASTTENQMIIGQTEPLIEGPDLKWWQFFLQKEVLAFFSFILVPAFLCYMYLEYYFPIFAQDNGLPTSMVGIIFSLYGLFIVYLGPSISTWSEKLMGAKNATALASLLTGLSLIVFALTGNLAGAILAVLVLALSDSFGETVYTTYFLALQSSARMGLSIASGYYEFVQQVGKMLGALAFGIAIGFGAQLGIGAIGVITLVMSVIFYASSLGKASR